MEYTKTHDAIQFKIKVPGVSWEETQVIAELEFSIIRNVPAKKADHVASQLVAITSREVRWNVKGSLQGHYHK